MKLVPRLKAPFLGLSGRVFLTVLGGVAVALVAFALVSVQALESSTDNTLRERLALAEVTAGRLDDFVDQTIRVTETMIDATGLASGAASLDERTRFVAALYDHLGESAYYVAIVDPDFRARLVYPLQSEVLGHDFSDSNCVNHAFDQALPQVTRSFTLGTPTPAVAMNVPILTPDGAVAGVVVVTLDLNASNFGALIEARDLGETGYIEVVDRTGIILGATRSGLRWKEDDHAGFFQTLILERQTSVGTCHNCHAGDSVGNKREDLVAFAPLSVAPWGIAVRQARDEAFIHTDTLRRRLIAIGGLSFIVIGIATLLLTQHLVKPLRGLTAACGEIAGGNLDTPLPERGPAEVGLLGDAFDTMRGRLKSSLQEINTWNTELEGLVSERSKELEASREELIKANRDISALNRLSFALTQSMDVETTLNTALDYAVTLAQMEGGWICILDGEVTHFAAARDVRGVEGACLCDWPPARSVIDRCLADGRALAEVMTLPPSDVSQDAMAAPDRKFLLVCVPLPAKGRVVGLLSLISPKAGRHGDVDLALLESTGAQIGTAVQNALLYRAVLAGEEAHRDLLHKVITAQEEERRRIARELHDETSQALTALSVGLETAMRAPAETPDDIQARLAPMKALSAGISHELQRMIQDLRPSLLDDLGLIAAIDWYAGSRLGVQGTRIAWETDGSERRLPTELETTIFRIAQEAISNVARHARAENVRIALEQLDEQVILEIEDDGHGFDAAAVLSARQPSGAYGLMGMQERVTLLNGDLVIDSAPGQGTRVRVAIPVDGRK